MDVCAGMFSAEHAFIMLPRLWMWLAPFWFVAGQGGGAVSQPDVKRRVENARWESSERCIEGVTVSFEWDKRAKKEKEMGCFALFLA